MPILLIILLTLAAILLLYALYIAWHIKKHGEQYPNQPSITYTSMQTYNSPVFPDNGFPPCNNDHDCP